MKTLTIPFLSAALLLSLSSCGDSEGGQSVPVDSVKATGTAPVQYSEGTPDTRVDTTFQERNAHVKDTLSGGAQQRTLPQNTPQGNGANTSNTTDRRTTSGSANNGDADGDRKR